MKLALASAGTLAAAMSLGTMMFFASFTGVAPTTGTVVVPPPLPSPDLTGIGPEVLSAVQETGCQDLVVLTAQMKAPGIDINVCRAWVAQENGGGPGQPANNFLFIGCTTGPCMTLAGRDWATYPTPADGAAAIAALLGAKPYAGVVASFGQDPVLQMSAIGQSPWCECHYGDPPGAVLIRNYQGVLKALGAKQ